MPKICRSYCELACSLATNEHTANDCVQNNEHYYQLITLYYQFEFTFHIYKFIYINM